MTEFDAVLIYDGECPFCSAAASAMRRTDGVGAVAHDDPAARSFLEAQFEAAPFALALADGDQEQVYIGREAATELCGRAGLPVLVRDIVGDNYESIADAVRTVVGADRDPDPYHGTYPFSTAASERYGELAAAAEPELASEHVRGSD